MKESLRIIQNEHRSISSVLHALKHLTSIADDATIKPELGAFRAMIRYMEEKEILPLAERHFTAQDWKVADEGLASRRTPTPSARSRRRISRPCSRAW